MPVSEIKYEIEDGDDCILLKFYRENDIGVRRWETYTAYRDTPFGKYRIFDIMEDLDAWIVRDLNDKHMLAKTLTAKLNRYLAAAKRFKRKGNRNGHAD